MKKRSLFIVVAMVLLLAVVLGMGGTTFAKYITSEEGNTATATVAEWGYVITVNTAGMFGENYQDGSIIATPSGENVLDVSGDGLVVAPGTSGSMSFAISGEAEVDSEIIIDVDTVNSKTVTLTKYNDPTTATDDEDLTAANYEPIKWTLNDGSTNLVNGGNLDALLTALNNLDVSNEVGTNYSKTYTISWVWAFDSNEDASSNDLYDTILGDMAAGTGKYYNASNVCNLTVALDFTITVQQVQNPLT